MTPGDAVTPGDGTGSTSRTGRTGRAVAAGPATIIALAAAVVIGLLAPVAGVGPAVPALAADADLTLVTDATYTVQPTHKRVRVSVTIVARNRRSETRTRKFYFDHAFLAVPAGTGGYAITGAKGSTVRVARRTKDAVLLNIGFGPRLYGGDTRTYRLGFDIVDRGRPANRQVRVGSSLVTFPVWAYASDGAHGSRVSVRFPAGYDVAVESGRFASRSRTADGGTQLATEALADPLVFFAYVSAQRAAVFRDSDLVVDAGGQPISLTMRAWRDDHAWAGRIGGLFRKALPVLRRDIGLDWPETEPTIVQEAVSRSAGGYAGLFDPAAHRIEVAYWAKPLVALHEASHGWFNGALLADRWASEGFASLYAQRAAATLKQKSSSPRLTDAVRKAAIPLNAWPGVAATDGDADPAVEAYGYAASLALARAIAERAGDEALRGVWQAAAARVGAYQPPVAVGDTAAVFGDQSEPETVDGPADWRALLDLFEGGTGEDFSDLWRQWVVTPDEAGLLDARAAARASYEHTLAVAGDWNLPRSIRDDLRAWRFDAAEQQMADARTVLAQRGAVEALAARTGVELPPTMQQRFQAGDMTGASTEAEGDRNALLAIGEAAGSRIHDDDVLSRIGMLGEDPEASLAAARASLEAGDLAGAQRASDDAYRAWNGAWQEGRRRALLAMAIIASVLVLVAAVAARARIARRERAASARAGS